MPKFTAIQKKLLSHLVKKSLLSDFINLFFTELCKKVAQDDFDAYYFMKYGRIPGSVTDTEKPEPSQKMKILKASVAFFGISFFICLFIVLASIGFNIDTDFPMVNVTENYFKFDTSNNTSNDTLTDTLNDTSNDTLNDTSNDTLNDTSFPYNTTVVQGTVLEVVEGTPTAESQFQCQFWSIPLRFRCDGITHCVPDGSDEQDCPEVPTIPSPTVLEVGP